MAIYGLSKLKPALSWSAAVLRYAGVFDGPSQSDLTVSTRRNGEMPRASGGCKITDG
jgi:hypothetical protein